MSFSSAMVTCSIFRCFTSSDMGGSLDVLALALYQPFGGHIPAAESSARRANSRASATL